MYRTLINSSELLTLLDEEAERVAILDCRASLTDPDYLHTAYHARHLPGAQPASLEDVWSGEGAGRHPLPERATLAATLRRLGIEDHSQIVVYDDAGGRFAARAWWCVRWLGHGQVAVLDGGLQAWPGPWATGDPEAPAPGRFSERAPLTRDIDTAAVAALVSNAGGPRPNRLVDARSRARFQGDEEPIDPVAGHIPGAACLPCDDNLDSNGQFRAQHELAARFTGLGDEPVFYCGSGVTAAHNILAYVHAGNPEPILYPGSWSAWIENPDRPVATGS